MIESGRSIMAAPDKIFAQTFFEDIDKGLNSGLVGVSNTSGERKCPKNSENSQMMIILLFQISYIQTKKVDFIPKMMR